MIVEIFAEGKRTSFVASKIISVELDGHRVTFRTDDGKACTAKFENPANAEAMYRRASEAAAKASSAIAQGIQKANSQLEDVVHNLAFIAEVIERHA